MWCWQRLVRTSWLECVTNEVLTRAREGRTLWKTVEYKRSGTVAHLLQHSSCFSTLFEGLIEGCKMRVWKDRNCSSTNLWVGEKMKSELYAMVYESFCSLPNIVKTVTNHNILSVSDDGSHTLKRVRRNNFNTS